MEQPDFSSIISKRPYLSIRSIENYEKRLRNDEKKRDIEKSETLLSVQHLGFDSAIAYKESGQPFLVNYPHLHLSISHSKGWIAVYVAEKPVGIDIEVENDRILYGATYYINQHEAHFMDDVKLLHLVWGAKEAFYKLKEGKIANSKEDITVKSINFSTQQIEVVFEATSYFFDFLQEGKITVVLN